MKKFRLIILFILSITLPSLGLASMNLMAQCNLMTETSDSASAMKGMPGMPDGCMTGKRALPLSQGKQQSSQTCKVGSNCSLNIILTSFTSLHLSAPYYSDVQLSSDTPFSPPLEGQWRPPRLS